MEQAARPATGAWRRFRKFVRHNGAPYLFVSPFFILFGVFMLYPVVFSFILSFKEWNGLSPMVNVGLRNYTELLRDAVFLQSLLNSVVLFFLYVPVMTFGAIVLAVILNGAFIRLRSVFRAFVFLPYVTSVVAVGFTFMLLLDRDYGLINGILTMVGLPKVGWLLIPNALKVSLAGLVTWRWLGYNMVLILAGLQNIPTELYDSARVDGANPFQTLFRITIPLLRPVIFFAMLLSVIGTFGLFTEPLILGNGNNGGPLHAIMSPVLYLYNNAFGYFKLGYAAAIGYVYFGILFVLTLVQWRFFGRPSSS